MTDNLPDVPLKPTTVRFGEAQWRFIKAQADREGVTAGQFVRDAAFGRAVLQWATNATAEEKAALRAVLGGSPGQEDLIALLERVTPGMYADDDG